MIERGIAPQLSYLLAHFPALVLLGPRQAGKTTLALDYASRMPSLYLDLENEGDRAKLTHSAQYFTEHADELIILDEVHRLPEIFQTLRGVIDAGRRTAKNTGRFLLLGSASLELLRQSESLAGRVTYLELGSLNVTETGAETTETLWRRGGFPQSFLATPDALSQKWRQDFIRTYLERDIPQLGGTRIASETLRRFWTMLAHNQSQIFHASHLARSLGVSAPTVAHYLDLMTDLLLVRRLPAWHGNLGKRLIKSPKVFIRDSGIAHTLLGIQTQDDLLSHPAVGQTWESFVIENLIAAAPDDWQPYFYRTAGGSEIDLLLQTPGGALWAIEIKRSDAPKIAKGFYAACQDLKPVQKFIVYSGHETFPMGDGITAISLPNLAARLRNSP